MNTEKIKLNRTQALGLVFLVICMFSYLGGFAWLTSMWDTELVETYRGYEIHYIPYHEMYGINVTGGPVEGWPFNTKLEGARNMIDSWEDEPIFIENYRDYEIVRQASGLKLYYAVDPVTGERVTANTVDLQTTRDNVDQTFYGLQVWVINYGPGDVWHIMKLGVGGDAVYYAELKDGDTVSPEFKQNHDKIPASEEPPEEPTSAEDPNTEVPDVTTIGDYLNTQKIMISLVSGVLGVGLVVLGSTRREE